MTAVVPVQSAERLPLFGCQATEPLLALAALFSRRHFLFLITESSGGGCKRYSAGFHENTTNLKSNAETHKFTNLQTTAGKEVPRESSTLSPLPPLSPKTATKIPKIREETERATELSYGITSRSRRGQQEKRKLAVLGEFPRITNFASTSTKLL